MSQIVQEMCYFIIFYVDKRKEKVCFVSKFSSQCNSKPSQEKIDSLIFSLSLFFLYKSIEKLDSYFTLIVTCRVLVF